MKDKLKYLIYTVCLVTTLNASQKAPIIAKDFISENTLHDAVRSNDLDVVKYLIKQGVKINQQDNYGYTPLHLAVRLHDLNVTKYLIENGATPNTFDTYKDTPLVDATRNDDTEIAKLLICAGAKRNIADSNEITLLQYSSQNKNKEITNLLRVDNLVPYCQKKIKISMDKFERLSTNVNTHKICGKIEKGNIINIDLEFQDEDDEIFGPFKANVDNNNKSWCLDVEKTTLKDDVYDVKAIATDYVVNNSSVLQLGYTYAEFLEVKFDDNNHSDYPYPRICGTTNSNAIDQVNVAISSEDGEDFGTYYAQINDNAKTWCVDVSKKLDHGTYILSGVGIDLYDQFVNFKKENYTVGKSNIKSNDAVNSHDIAIEIPGLYDALMDEFKDDLIKWNASLDKNTLVFRFNDPSMMFQRGQHNLKDKFKEVLDSFFPRYVSIVKEFEDYIQEITIEGHSSSEHRLGRTKVEKFRLNQMLSAQRANAVLSYTSLITKPEIVDNIIWVVTTFKSKGFSSSELIYNSDKTENKELSRRVDFRITTKDK